MNILAFETSCDDTSIAIFADDRLIAMDTKSQIKEHLDTCWVVPEVAARLHANNVFLVLDTVLQKAWMKLEDIDYIACTNDPWLLPSLYVWITVATTISKLLSKPLIFINHIQAHIFANLLERREEDLNFPMICLTVSWWHNELYIWKSLFDLELIWETQDDSAWEAFDKVAKMMWVWFPWWPVISRLASEYDWNYDRIFPKVLLSKDSLDFSFSWLKTAVKREIDERITKKENQDPEHPLYDNSFSTKYLFDIQRVERYLSIDDKRKIAFEFENTVVDILTTKLFMAANKYSIKSLALAWWVSANNKLKEEIMRRAVAEGYTFLHPKTAVYSQDNAAMVWMLAFYRIKYNKPT